MKYEKIIVTILRVILAIVVFGSLGLIVGTAAYDSRHPYNKSFSNRREMDGTVFSSMNGHTKIITDDGLEWNVDNFLSNIGIRCTVKFDTKNTDIPEDDTVIEITTHTPIR